MSPLYCSEDPRVLYITSPTEGACHLCEQLLVNGRKTLKKKFPSLKSHPGQ